MNGKIGTMRSAILLILCVVIAVSISVFFVSQMNSTIENNTLNTISELAEHDRLSIQNFVARNWDDLYSIQERFESYNCDTILEIQERMNLERASGDFNALYLIAEDGSIYTDRYMVYPKDERDIMQYFEEGKNQTVKRYDYNTATELQKETILYGIRLEDYTVEGIHFVALIGISNISQIQNEIMITSFVRDGKGRGYSSVVNFNGDFIVNINQTVSLNKKANLYDMLEKGKVGQKWGKESIVDRMKKKEIFYFYFMDENGTEQLIYFMPIETTGWYFLTMVEKSVFTEQSRSFTFLSLGMLGTVIVIVVLTLLFLTVSHNKALKATAEAKAKNDFLSNMSHEIRTPLNGVIGLLHLMRIHVQDGDPKQMAEWIDKTHATANYLLSLLSNILDMTKIQEGKLKLTPEPFMIDSMLDEVCAMQKNNIESKGIQFIVEKEITVPCVIGDKLRIEQVLMNILGNAAKFTQQGGLVRLSLEQERTEEKRVTTKIVCEDTGIGMSPQFLEKIWDSFSQEHNTKTSNIRGTGLGMALSKLFIDAMGGEITVESKLDEGSVFTIVLNFEIADMDADSADNVLESGESNEEKESVRILIAEDNELNAEILVEILSDMGFQTTLAQNGQIAVDKFQESEPFEYDYILMDMQMPVMDGCQATENIRHLNRPDALTIPIFACTANIFQEDRDRALKSGMNDFLIKPIDINVLLMKLNQKTADKVEAQDGR